MALKVYSSFISLLSKYLLMGQALLEVHPEAFTYISLARTRHTVCPEQSLWGCGWKGDAIGKNIIGRGQVSPTSLFVPSDKKLHETKAKTILYKSIPTLPSVPTVMFKVPDYGTLTSGSFLKGPILRAASVGLISGSE